jgi:ArsR family transcriptional regulator
MVQIRKNRVGRTPRPSTRSATPANPRDAALCARPVDGLLDPALFKALGDPTRVQLLACLMKCGRACLVGEVAECCSVDLSVVSRHLQALAREGVLASSKVGRMVSYRVCYASLAQRLRDLAEAIDACAPSITSSRRAGSTRLSRASRRCEGGSCGC